MAKATFIPAEPVEPKGTITLELSVDEAQMLKNVLGNARCGDITTPIHTAVSDALCEAGAKLMKYKLVTNHGPAEPFYVVKR